MEKKEQGISKGLKEIEKILKQKDKLYENVSIYSSNAERLFAASQKVLENKDCIGIGASLLIMSFEECIKGRWLLNYVFLEIMLPSIENNANLKIEEKMFYKDFFGSIRNNAKIFINFNPKKLNDHQNKFNYIYNYLNLLKQFSMMNFEELKKEQLNFADKIKNQLESADATISGKKVEIIQDVLNMIKEMEKIINIVYPLAIKFHSLLKNPLIDFFKKVDIKEIKNFDKIRKAGFYRYENPDFNYYEFIEKWKPIIKAFIKGLSKYMNDYKKLNK
ncbi:MAG: hypothetical protein M0Z72_01265 [Deltaproteobacteria bacterium]|nr:hypothetical protein [Deltaproteobacteria bacterium]